MDYITIKQASSNWGIGIRQVQNHCKNGDIKGAVRFNGVWAIPVEASKPADGRRKCIKNSQTAELEKLLRENDAPDVFKEVFDLFPYRLNITDANGYMVYANEAFFKGTLPKVRTDAIGQYNIRHEPLLEKWGLTDHIHRAFRGEAVYTPGLRFPNKDLIGSKYDRGIAFFTLYNDVSSFSIFTEDMQLRYVVTVFIPVREYSARDEVVCAKEYIEAHWLEPFSTKCAAQAAHLSVTSFVQLFQSETGITPHQYYVQMRLTRLRNMLINSNHSIAQSFELCGMEYNSYYAALFKKHSGLTPKQFREQNK